MKYTFLIIFVLLATISYSQQPSRSAIDSFFKAKELSNKEAIGKPFPSFSAGSITNESLKEKVVFINFWFEACAPCVAEFEGLNRLYEKLKDRKDFVLISFTFETPEKIKEVKDKYHIQYPVISISKDECYRLNQHNGFPTSIIVDSKGLMKYLTEGGNIDKEKASTFIMTEVYPRILLEL